ncbi:hypothetical protein M9H77_28956 [Catharanthus roseus]|uniref:Uncharacterized protein n=1 Tax=Catharanthus roseus TaxID=4058 RepID=A0ACC0AGV6_CATRO|nr:hypothetical protein M9H77_28956 [Catharanthus roseus]
MLAQISSIKDMLDQVNEDIETNIQITRHIESEIVKCDEIEIALAARESELTRSAYELQYQIFGLKEEFIITCLDFQEFVSDGENDGVGALLTEKEFLENEIHALSKKNNTLQNSMTAFVEEVLEDLQGSITALEIEIHSRKSENEKLLKDIDELKATLLLAISTRY